MTIDVSVITTANHTSRFKLDGADSINRVLDSLKSCGHFFSGKPLIIGSAAHTEIFAADSLACIELASALDLESVVPGGQNLTVTALTGDELATPFSGGFDGKNFTVRIDLFFQGGHALCTRVEGERKPALAERLTNLTSIFERPVVVYRLAQGGIGLLNPRTVTRLRITPGAPELPRDAWLTDHR